MQLPTDPSRAEAPAPAPPLPPVVSSRRRALFATAAAVACGAGATLAWRRRSQPDAESAATHEAGLWSQTFDTPEGGRLALQTLRGQPLLLNFWATWCPPCIEELPLLDRFAREQAAQQWRVVGLAIDQAVAVRKFLQSAPVSFPIGIAGLGGTALGKDLGNLTGGLPFTVVLGRDGRIAHRKMGQLRPTDLAGWVGTLG